MKITIEILDKNIPLVLRSYDITSNKLSEMEKLEELTRRIGDRLYSVVQCRKQAEAALTADKSVEMNIKLETT